MPDYGKSGSINERPSPLRCAGLQGQRMQFATHFGFKRLVYDLVLLDTRFAAKRLGDDGRRIVIAIAGEVADRHDGIRDACPDQSLDIARGHGHGNVKPVRAPTFHKCDIALVIAELSLHSGKSV